MPVASVSKKKNAARRSSSAVPDAGTTMSMSLRATCVDSPVDSWSMSCCPVASSRA
eukprot:CAMPEP_0176114582 /NCGR_PEP_ID=MMETSP0120_2-20121206/57540_1 /TAXON_ID=160619 /ORGANISM="Kryptoperidinium foliaceum, Strain CCMP 1326" /LENGTH=55 /DNA_ID=CAMNT_0017448813 /DNA_START=28 /DNA_END=195 /DNA_ORIENTATION=+